MNAIHEYLESWSYFDWFCGALANENLQIADQPMRSLWADLTQRIPAKTKCFQNGFLWYFKPTKQLPLPLPVPSRLCTVLLYSTSWLFVRLFADSQPWNFTWVFGAPLWLQHSPHTGPQRPHFNMHQQTTARWKPNRACPYYSCSSSLCTTVSWARYAFLEKRRFLFWPHAWKHGQIDSCDMMLSVMACDGEQLNQSPDVHSWLSGSCSMNMPRRAILWPYHHIPPLGSPVRWPIRRNSRMASWDRCAGMDGPRNILIQNTAAVNPLRPWSVTSGVASGRGTLLEIKSQWASERC